MRIGIIGAGSFGTTLAKLWSDAGHKVTLWAREEEVVKSINEVHRNCLFYPEVELNENVIGTSELTECLTRRDALVLAVPSKFLRDFVPTLVKAWLSAKTPERIPLISIVKGILYDPTELVSSLVKNALSQKAKVIWVQFSGPNISAEIIRGLPTASVLASEATDVVQWLQMELSAPTLRLYTSTDPIGVEVCGAVKNCLALACGMASGLELGMNARAVLITRGTLEIQRIVEIFGGNPQTAYGLSGLGDLVVTGFSENSRNFRAGKALAQGKTLAEIEASTREVAEGVRTTKAIVDLIRGQADESQFPIIMEVYRVIYEDKPAQDAIKDLMARPLKSES